MPCHNLMTAVVGLEQSRSPADLMRVVESLREWRRSTRDDELMRVFAEWVGRLMEGFMPTGAKALPPVQTLEEVTMTLEERVASGRRNGCRKAASRA